MSKTSSFRQYFRSYVPKSWGCFKEGYSLKTFKSDLIAGVTIGVIALPLSMAFAIAAGASPASGLYTAIIAGFLVSLLGGSYFQIAGPTGAFVVIIYDIILRRGYEGLAVATILAGIILIICALSRLGTLIKYIPYPLIIGFTSGLALMIFISQIKDFLGLSIDKLPPDLIHKCIALYQEFPSFEFPTFCLASFSLLGMILVRRYFPSIPWGITIIAIATCITYFFHLPVETIESRFGNLPSYFPPLTIPHFSIPLSKLSEYFQDAIAIAFLAGIESLLSAVVADGMTGRVHKSNAELLAQGIANIGSIFFGGIPATGAIARTAASIKTGAKTPVAGMIHALVLLLILLFCSPLVSKMPLAAISAALMMVAWNMSEIGHFKRLFRAPIGDVVVLLLSFFLTIFIDLVVAIEIGMIFAAFLFMKRVKDISGVTALIPLDESETDKSDPDAISKKKIPINTEVYEVVGLFFFGLADSLKRVLADFERPPKVFILRLRKVERIDASGLHALKEFYELCHKRKTALILSGVNPHVHAMIKKFGLAKLIGDKQIYSHIDPSLERAKELCQ